MPEGEHGFWMLTAAEALHAELEGRETVVTLVAVAAITPRDVRVGGFPQRELALAPEAHRHRIGHRLLRTRLRPRRLHIAELLSKYN